MSFVDAKNHALLFIKKYQEPESPEVEFVDNYDIRLNIGAGKYWYDESWKIVDASSVHSDKDNVIATDITDSDGLNDYFQDNSVDCIYSSHTLEHFLKKDAEKLLMDCFSILKDGAPLRIVVPCLDIITSMYVDRNYNWWANNNMSGGKRDNDIDTDMTIKFLDAIGSNDISRDLGNKNESVVRGCHYYAYSKITLSKVLKDIGFNNISVCFAGKSKYEAFKIFNASEKIREMCSLHIECIK